MREGCIAGQSGTDSRIRGPRAHAYRGRLAPSPTGYLHVGHARTFRVAHECARAAGGIMVLRIEDLDTARCRPEFIDAVCQDLRWCGLEWQEGPDVGGPDGPYLQSARRDHHREVLERLRTSGAIFPCTCSRRDIASAASAPHAADEEPVYPGTCRPRDARFAGSTRVAWRFRVPEGEEVRFMDGHFGLQRFVPGRDFGDFVVWRADGVPGYQLACVADDHAMRITEVVRGADLLVSTARQLLLYRALGWTPPEFRHVPLVCDASGRRLSKRDRAQSLRSLREAGIRPDWDRLSSAGVAALPHPGCAPSDPS